MLMSLPVPLPRPTRLLFLAQCLLLPEGGQRAARQNAWAGMVADASRSRDRQEADQAVALAAGSYGAVELTLRSRAGR